MPKPPKSPPNSDLDGVDEDAVQNTDAARAAGQDTKDLELARKEAVGRPDHSDEESLDDRSRH